MNQQLTYSRPRQRTYTESTELESNDELFDSWDKRETVAFLKEQGEEYSNTIKPVDNKINQNVDVLNSGLQFEDLLDEGASISTESFEIVTNDTDEDEAELSSLRQDTFDNPTDEIQSTKVDCFRCADVSRIYDGNKVTVGSHVKFGRYAPFNKANNFLKKHLKGRLGFLYYHHAIVTNIHKQGEKEITIDIVEFTKQSDDKNHATIEVAETYNMEINLEDEFLFMVEYKQLPFTADEIVDRARRLKGCKSYNLFSNNCEHIAIWCVTNLKASFQSDHTGDAAHSWLTWFMTMLAKISHLSFMSKDIASATKLSLTRVAFGTLAASMACPIICAIVECIILIKRLIQLKKQLKRRLICLCCFNKKKITILAKLVLCFVVSIALIIPTTKYGLPVVGIGILTMVVLPWACEKLITKIKAKINPTSVLPKMIVKHMTDIQPGDVLSISTGLSFHDVIVEKVKLIERKDTLNKLSLDIVHYAFCGLLGTRTVTKEQIDIDLDRESLLVYDFPKEESFSHESTVARAIMRVGEKKFNMFTRRSSHMVWECKVLPRVKSSHTKRPVISLGEVREVQEGDVIEFRYCWLPHVAVVVKVKSYVPSDIIELTYVHVNKNNEISEDREVMDLETSNVYVQIYDQNKIDQNHAVVTKAKKRLGEKITKSGFYKSSHFALSCKLKPQDSHHPPV